MEHIRERHVKDKQAAREKTPEARSKAQAAVKSAQGTEPLKSEVYEVAHTQPRVQWKEVSQTAGLSGVNAKSRTKINREPLKRWILHGHCCKGPAWVDGIGRSRQTPLMVKDKNLRI